MPPPPHVPHPPHSPAPRRKVTYRDVVAAELELQELERQHEEMLQLQRELPLMRSRLQAMRKGTTRREQAVVKMIEQKEDELLRVRDEIDFIQSMQDTSNRIWPALTTSEPLGDSLALAVKDFKDLGSKKEGDVLSMSRPAAWPSPLALADLWLACVSMDSLNSFLGSSQSSRVTWEGMGLEVNAKGSQMLHTALDTAEALLERFSPEQLRTLKGNHQKLRGDMDVTTRAYELRLRAVIDSQCPMQRALCIQELKHLELVLLLYRRLVTLSEDEANWYLEVKARLMSEGKEERARQLISETYKVKRYLEEVCDLEPKSADDWAGKEHAEHLVDEETFHSLHSMQIFHVVTARKEVEQLRQKVSAAEVSLDRSTHPKLASVDAESRAMLQAVKEQVKEAHKLLESFATWASKTEAALTLFGLTEPCWCAIAALAPTAMIDEAARLRQVMAKIGNLAKKKKAPGNSPKPRPKVTGRRSKSVEVLTSRAKIKEAKRRSTWG